MSKSAMEYLQSEVTRASAKAKGIARKAEDEDRALTSDERMEVEGLIAEANKNKARVQEMADNAALLEAIDDAGVQGANGTPTVEQAKDAGTLGEAFTRSSAYKGLKARGLTGKWTTGPVEFAAKLDDNGGASGGNTVVSITGAGGDLPLSPQVLPILGPVEQRLYVSDLFGQATATQNSIVYLEETSTTPGALNAAFTPANAATADAVTTAEGALKPAAFVDFTKRSATIEKIAAFLPISDEMLEDEPQIASYINQRLPLFVRQAEEAYVTAELLAAGIGAADSNEVGGSNLFDAIAAGIMVCQLESGLEPDSLAINPADFWAMSVLRAQDGDGAYFSGGPYAGPARNPWGLRTVVTSTVAAGSPIVGAFREGATVFRRGGLSVEASNSHADYFLRNLTAVRAEERLALVVLRPSAFQVVTVGS